MNELSSFKDIHKGKDIIVCGCGESLRDLTQPERFITIGVNDVGRLFHPDYLVVVNPRRQFSGDRFRFVETSQAKYLFTQLELGISHPNIVKFKLGTYGGTNGSDPNVLHYTQNSPYVALCLAAHMGASRIGLIGVDFTDNHFFGKTGKHALAGQLAQVDVQYLKLRDSFAQRGIEILNLSANSRLTALPKMDIELFYQSRENSDESQLVLVNSELSQIIEARGNIMQKIAIEKHKPGIVGDFLDGLARTAQEIGYEVSREPMRTRTQPDVVSIVWNGRNFSSRGPTLYCEHAWLPRWEYQISPNGINADSHIAPFVWDGKPLGEQEKAALENHLATIRQGAPKNYEYMRTDLATAMNLPDKFLLVPLQMEWDTNIQRHVPVRYKRMQALVDDLARANPPLPIIYKQHPADVRRGNQQLRLRVGRRQDAVWPHEQGNIHQLLKSGQCKGIISLNSNVVHDGLIWGVPSVVLGANVWPRSGAGPFGTVLPRDWEQFFASGHDGEATGCRDAYAYYLMKNQWKLEDVHDTIKVESLIADASSCGKRSAYQPKIAPALQAERIPRINVVAVNRGWFFEDVKRHMHERRRRDCVIVDSERPRRDSDAWIFLRTKEAGTTPDPDRTIVQIHDLFDEGLYRPGGERRCVDRCAAVILTHPDQRQILDGSGVDLSNREIIERPIGALESFDLRTSIPERFTLAWVGRPATHFGKEVKKPEVFVQVVKRLSGDSKAILLGERLDQQHRELRSAGIDCEYHQRIRTPILHYPRHYKKFDCLVITSASEAGPLCLFEALATGVPVVSTRVGWAPLLIQNGVNGYLADSEDEILEAVDTIRRQREAWFEQRTVIRESLQDITLESWLDQNIDLALRLAAKSRIRIESGARGLQPAEV